MMIRKYLINLLQSRVSLIRRYVWCRYYSLWWQGKLDPRLRPSEEINCLRKIYSYRWILIYKDRVTKIQKFSNGMTKESESLGNHTNHKNLYNLATYRDIRKISPFAFNSEGWIDWNRRPGWRKMSCLADITGVGTNAPQPNYNKSRRQNRR